HWKANLLAAHIQGKLLLFKTISQDQREMRSDFRPVPINTTPAQAEQWLKQNSSQFSAQEVSPGVHPEAVHPAEARLNPAQGIATASLFLTEVCLSLEQLRF